MASGNKNYFRHSFNARNDEFIVGLMNEFKEKGYYMWFALCEMSGEMIADGHAWPLKFNQSRLYKELKCNHSTLTLFLTYCGSRSKVHSTYSDSTFNLEIPNLSKYIGKYSKISPNKRKEKEIKEKEIIIISNEKNLPEKDSQLSLKKSSPLSFLFSSNPEIQAWLDDGIHETHMMLLKKYSHAELADLIEKAFVWAKPRKIRAETWLFTFTSNKNTQAYGVNQGQVKFKSKTNGVASTAENPTGNPYKAQRLAMERNGESA